MNTEKEKRQRGNGNIRGAIALAVILIALQYIAHGFGQ